MHDTFISAIHAKQIILVEFNSKEKGVIKRTCVPFDFGPSRRYKDGLDRYHFSDLDSPDGTHTLSILPEQLKSITVTDKTFSPGNHITWNPNWFVSRDWGKYS